MPFLQTLGGGSASGFGSTSSGGGSVPSISASGGDSTGEYDADGFTWRYHKFTTTGNSTFTVSSAGCLLYTSPSPRDVEESRMPSSA